MNETPQMQADAMLTEDREARAALRAGHNTETAARAALAAIERDARERARPYLDALARLEALRPAASFVIPREPLGAALGDRFGRAPYSRADQVRNALLAAFETMEETVTTRARLRKLLAAASDRTLELVGRYLKNG